ncbi:unnamed protein product, partial [Discosporangium mesarthrocarpum]
GNWTEALSRALSRQGSPERPDRGSGGGGWGGVAFRDSEEEVGSEEDASVARFVLMLLQYNFPFVSHVRGDMTACLQQLSTQGMEEDSSGHSRGSKGRGSPAKAVDLLDSVLIGTEAERYWLFIPISTLA